MCEGKVIGKAKGQLVLIFVPCSLDLISGNSIILYNIPYLLEYFLVWFIGLTINRTVLLHSASVGIRFFVFRTLTLALLLLIFWWNLKI